MSKPWKELLHVVATYYAMGETPIHWDAEYRRNTAEAIAEDWDLWWFPGVKDDDTFDAKPSHTDEGALTTEAIHFEVQPVSQGTSQYYASSSLLASELDGTGARDAFLRYLAELKVYCDYVRGMSGARTVETLIVFECEAGKDPDTWAGPGDYWSDYQPIGLLSLDPLTIINEVPS